MILYDRKSIQYHLTLIRASLEDRRNLLLKTCAGRYQSLSWYGVILQGRRSIFLSGGLGAGAGLQVHVRVCNNGGRREGVRGSEAEHLKLV